MSTERKVYCYVQITFPKWKLSRCTPRKFVFVTSSLTSICSVAGGGGARIPGGLFGSCINALFTPWDRARVLHVYFPWHEDAQVFLSCINALSTPWIEHVYYTCTFRGTRMPTFFCHVSMLCLHHG